MQIPVTSRYDELADGNPPHSEAGIFGLNVSSQEAKLILVEVPWEGTVSYGRGTAAAPQAIRRASHQLDLFDLEFGEVFRIGICMGPLAGKFPYLAGRDTATVNYASLQLNELVYKHSRKILEQGKFLGIVGGEHSVPLGALRALGEQHEAFGILHIDAHHDLRRAYEGFTYSHASIMFNVLTEVTAVKRIVSVGVRDFCKPEFDFARAQKNRIRTFYDTDLLRKKASGKKFASIADKIVSELPDNVYVSFDIDGLDPSNCPGTGTPVPGGLSYHEAIYLLHTLVGSGKKVIGFDLCEVAPAANDQEWNANVGARILYKLCGSVATSHKLLEKV